MRLTARLASLQIKRQLPYAWAERAKTVGYPERFAQDALGHNSKAVHRAYAKCALMKLPSLEDYEQRAAIKTKPTSRLPPPSSAVEARPLSSLVNQFTGFQKTTLATVCA
jgi:hypothetical protein